MGRLFWVCAGLAAALPSGAQTTVILPFSDPAASESQAWIGESIAETLTDFLAGDGYLTVDRRDRDEVLRQLGVKPTATMTRATVLKIAMSIDASHVVYGRFETANQEIRITASVADVKKLASLAQLVESGKLEDLSQVQTRLAWRAMRAIDEFAAPEREEFTRRHPAIKTEALSLFVRALHAPHVEIQVRDLTQAVRLDPNYTAPAFELGKLHFERKQWQEASLWLGRIHSNDWRAGEALFFLGLARYHLGDYAAARDAFAQVAANVPLSEVLNNLGASQIRLADPAALDNFEKALDGAESDPDYQFNAGYALLLRGEHARAADRFRAALERNPSDSIAMEMLGRSLRPEAQKPIPQGRERLKTEYQEAAFRQLKAVLSPAKNK
jgi:tetratricopeptide (TPR) repeat protein